MLPSSIAREVESTFSVVSMPSTSRSTMRVTDPVDACSSAVITCSCASTLRFSTTSEKMNAGTIAIRSSDVR
ncbi:hypothetical protein D3C72_1838550 [compost metagenome]